jgi:hypothetical protein
LFALTVLVYPLALALLCVGAGLLVDRCSGRFLPAALLPCVGAAALIALSQLSTYVSPLAQATPYLLLGAALAGFALARARVIAIATLLRSRRGPVGAALAAYLLALAPVLLAGRPTFSSFMALSDSAVHMIGADYLIHHGQDYAQLDLRNSYGQFIHNYYATSYPSGADTLFGASALLLHLPLIWAFQPFVALLLAFCSGPAWTLARAIGLRGAWAAAAALSATVPALVYGYALVGSVKEIVALAMILTLGALVVLHRRWLSRAPLRALPIALVLAAGVSALGVGFGVWALAAAGVLLVMLVGGRAHAGRGAGVEGHARTGREGLRAALATVAVGALALLVAAWPTWIHVSASLHVAQNIAATGNAGNLPAPLKWTQAFGVWLRGSYKQPPAGVWRALTAALVVVVLACCALGALHLLRTRRRALAAWIALMLLAWLVLSRTATTWVDAKALVLTSPVVVLLAWGGVAALLGQASPRRRRSRRGRLARRVPRPAGGPRASTSAASATRPAGGLRALAAALLALALLGGVLASDLAQYHSSNLAPTARYEELASIGERFAGRGPALFTDFDEYSMYELRRLDVGGPDFVYPPPALASLAGGYGRPVRLDRASPDSLMEYPLIVTRRDPSAPPPPAAYALAWQGAYYEVWKRPRGITPAVMHVASADLRPRACARLRAFARAAPNYWLAVVGAVAPRLVRVALSGAARPRGWGRQRGGFAMHRAGTLSVRFTVPRGGVWQLWLQGQFMARVSVAVDGRTLASIAGQLAGNSLVPDTSGPVSVRLSAGAHRLTVTRAGFGLGPGNGGSAVLAGAFLTPAGTPARALRTLSYSRDVKTLCSRRYEWVELVAG